jgi:hypothetical protein
MRITVRLVTWDRATWITGAEVVLLALLLTAASSALRLWLGLPVLGHLGYRALTSLPIGQVPGRPAGMARQRRNLQLRTRVVAFLNEVRRAESYAASTGGAPGEAEANLDVARARIVAAAEEVADVAGRFGMELGTSTQGSRTAPRF